jgi:hypothetical protein
VSFLLHNNEKLDELIRYYESKNIDLFTKTSRLEFLIIQDLMDCPTLGYSETEKS